MVTDVKKLLLCIVSVCILILGLSYLKFNEEIRTGENTSSYLYYQELKADESSEDPLKYLDDDFTASEDFSSNLPLVVLEMDGELPEYKTFTETEEIVNEGVEPWIGGTISLYQNENGDNSLSDSPVLNSQIRIKKRGHTSMSFDKSQYAIKLVDENGEKNEQNVFGMDVDAEWILNGSMADKSMIRNYIAYRTASHIMEFAPRSCFCEVFIKQNGEYVYQGVYLMMDTIKQSPYRVDIKESNVKNPYTSYLVRRDRFTKFDTMLETYGRIAGLDDEWIGLKYPGKKKQTEKNIDYIQRDFSKIEQILYSQKDSVFKQYGKYIDTDTFVDYFLINEYFGNYDAGEHSTYMYKNEGGLLKIGPVWDFDQAMNNSVVGETDPDTLAMQEKDFFSELCKDTAFIDALKNRYAFLQKNYLNDKYMFAMIDETEAYLKSARAREWYRWAADYYDATDDNPGNYYLDDYEYHGEVISRFNDNYDQEIYNIKVYLSNHGKVIQSRLTYLYDETTVTGGFKGNIGVFLFILGALFFIPSIIINRK